MRRAVACAAGLIAVVAFVRPVSAAEDSCDAVARRLRAQAVVMMPSRPQGVVATPGPNSPIAQLFIQTLTQRPDCRAELLQVAGSLRQQGPVHKPLDPSKTPLGPVGWLWLTIYTDIFRHSALLMALFGWQLFLAPLTIVICGIFVLRGAVDGMRKPVRVDIAGAD